MKFTGGIFAAVLGLAAAAPAQAGLIFATYDPLDATSVDVANSVSVHYKYKPANAAPWQWPMSQASILFTPTADTPLGEVIVPLRYDAGSGSVRAFLYKGSQAGRPKNESLNNSDSPLAGVGVGITGITGTGWDNVSFDFGGSYMLQGGTQYKITLRTTQFHVGGVQWFGNNGTPDFSADTQWYVESAQNHAIIRNNVALGFTPAIYITDGMAVPAPASAWLFGAGLLGLFVVGRRRFHHL